MPVSTKTEYAKTFIDQFEPDPWDWDEKAGIPARPIAASERRIDVRGHVQCSFENETGTGEAAGFRVGWIEDPGVQGIRVGGDWEHPVQAFAFMWPEETISGEPEGEVCVYVPKSGNLFNPHNGKPLGNDHCEGPHADVKWLQELGVMDEEPEHFNAHEYDLTPFLDFEEMRVSFLKWYYDHL